MKQNTEEQMTLATVPKILSIWHTKNKQRAYTIATMIQAHGITPHIHIHDGMFMVAVPYTKYNIELQQKIWVEMSSLPKYKKTKEEKCDELERHGSIE